MSYEANCGRVVRFCFGGRMASLKPAASSRKNFIALVLGVELPLRVRNLPCPRIRYRISNPGSALVEVAFHHKLPPPSTPPRGLWSIFNLPPGINPQMKRRVLRSSDNTRVYGLFLLLCRSIARCTAEEGANGLPLNVLRTEPFIFIMTTSIIKLLGGSSEDSPTHFSLIFLSK